MREPLHGGTSNRIGSTFFMYSVSNKVKPASPGPAGTTCGLTVMNNENPKSVSPCLWLRDGDFECFKAKFEATEKLYHYTSFLSALKIIHTGKLLYSSLKNLNDINESFRPVFVGCDGKDGKYPEIDLQLLTQAIQKFKQISFSMDKGENKGFAISAMWGHYAEKGNGVCLVFDKEKIEQQLKQDTEYGKVVEYSSEYDPSVISDNLKEDESAYVDMLFNSREQFFFTKTLDWSYEQEYRIIKKTDSGNSDYLEFGDALFAVIMYNAPDITPGDNCSASLQYTMLQEIRKDLPICCYASFLGDKNLSINGKEI